MPNESWLKDKHPFLIFAIVHISDKESLRRRLVMKTKKSNDSDRQDV